MFQGNVKYQNVGFITPQGYPFHLGSLGHFNGFPGGINNQSNTGPVPSFYAPSGPIADYGVVADSAWYIDSGATNHVTKDAGIFQSYYVFGGTNKLYIGNGLGLDIQHIGSALLSTLSTIPIHLNNILHVPAIIKNLLSVSKLLTNNDILIEFHSTCCFVKAKNSRTVLLKGIAKGGLYQVEGLTTVSNAAVPSNTRSNALSVTFESVSSVKHHHESMIIHLGVFDAMHTDVRLSGENIVPFNNEGSTALSASYSKSVDCNLLHKRMGHPIIHALKHIIKHLNSDFDMNKNIKPDFCNAC